MYNGLKGEITGIDKLRIRPWVRPKSNSTEALRGFVSPHWPLCTGLLLPSRPNGFCPMVLKDTAACPKATVSVVGGHCLRFVQVPIFRKSKSCLLP